MKNDLIIVGLLALLIGLFVGYVLAPRGVMMHPQGMYEMHEQMEDVMGHDEETEYEGDALMGHVMDEMMLGTRGKHGEEYEEAFLKMMIVHHQGAIEMSEELLRETERPELVTMANDIIEAQEKEVELMEGWLDEWFKK